MNPRVQAFVTIPTAVVALLCLLGDESLVSFLKKVGGTWLFFSVLTYVLASMWRAAEPGRSHRTDADDKGTRPGE